MDEPIFPKVVKIEDAQGTVIELTQLEEDGELEVNAWSPLVRLDRDTARTFADFLKVYALTGELRF